MRTLFQLQTESGPLWADIKAHLDAKDAAHAEAMAEKEAVIATLQPGYVPPAPPPIEDRAEEALLAALTDDERRAFADEIASVKQLLAAARQERAKPADDDIKPIADGGGKTP